MRDRAADMLAEEADLAGTLAPDVGRATPTRAFPRLHLPFDRLLAHTDAPAWTVDADARVARTPPVVAATGWGPVVGDGERPRPPARELLGRRLPRRRRRRRRGLGARGCTTCCSRRRPRPRSSTRRRDRPHPARRPHRRRAARPRVHAARGQAGGPRRGRPHRPAPRPPPAAARSAATAVAFFEDLKPGDYVVHHQHGVGRYGGHGQARRSAASSATTCCSSTRAATSSTSRPTRSTRCATTPAARRPTLHRLGGSDFAKAKAGSAPRCARSPRSSSCSTRSGVTRPGHAFAPDTPWQHEMEEAFPYVETPDQLKAIDDVKADMEAAVPDGPPGVRRRRLRQDRGRDPRRVQGDAGRQAGRRARAHHAARPAALPDVRRPLRRLPGPGRGAVAASSPRRRPSRWSTASRDGEVDVVIGTHRLLSDDIAVQGPRPAGRRRGAALRRQPQGGDQEAARPTSTCSR